MPDVTSIIFAGGLGTRLGGTKKALLHVGGRPIVERVVDAVQPLSVETIGAVGLADGFDVVMPVTRGQMDPMHPVYRRDTCLSAIGRARTGSLLGGVPGW